MPTPEDDRSRHKALSTVSQKSAIDPPAAENGETNSDSRRIRRQSHFSATVWTGTLPVDLPSLHSRLTVIQRKAYNFNYGSSSCRRGHISAIMAVKATRQIFIANRNQLYMIIELESRRQLFFRRSSVWGLRMGMAPLQSASATVVNFV